MKIDNVDIDGKSFIVAEVAQAHDGSLGFAHAFIDAVAKTGADAIKFQTHIASAESTLQEPWRIKFSSQDETRYEYWKRMEFTEDQWHGLKKHAEEKDLVFLSSPFSVEAVDLLKGIGVGAWKIASGELENPVMLNRLLETKLPILMSTGMSSINEIDTTVNKILSRGVSLAVMQCASMYPCPPEKIGLNMISYFRERYKCAVGLSDHSGKIFAGLAAATIGIDVLEVHVTLSREMFGPDVSSSLTTEELSLLVEGVRYIDKMKQNPVNKDVIANELTPMRNLFTKSIVAKSSLKAGIVLREEHLAFKKPGTGIPASSLNQIVGRRLMRNLVVDEQILESDLGDQHEK